MSNWARFHWYYRSQDPITVTVKVEPRGTSIIKLGDLEKNLGLTVPDGARSPTVVLYLFDPCSMMVEESFRREREELSDQAKRERSASVKAKKELQREAWAVKHGDRA